MPDIVSCEGSRACIGREESGEHPHGGGFTSTVGPKESDDFTFVHGEGNIRHDNLVAEVFAEVVCADEWVGHDYFVTVRILEPMQ